MVHASVISYDIELVFKNMKIVTGNIFVLILEYIYLQVVPTKPSNVQSTPSNIDAKYPNEDFAVDSKAKDMTYQFFEELLKQQEESNNR